MLHKALGSNYEKSNKSHSHANALINNINHVMQFVEVTRQSCENDDYVYIISLHFHALK